jgi:hypothetical protein
MTAISPLGRQRPLRSLVCCIIVTLFGAVPATVQQTHQLEQQLQQMKQQYQATTQELEQRFDAFEFRRDCGAAFWHSACSGKSAESPVSLRNKAQSPPFSRPLMIAATPSRHKCELRNEDTN